MRAPLAGFALAVIAAAPAQAAGDGLFYPTLNFLLLLGLLFVMARKPIQTFFGDRRDAVRRDLEEATALKKQADEQYSRWQRKMADLDSELDGIRATARERAENERENLLADARAAAERIRRDAVTAVDQELRRARAMLRDEASELSVELAAEVLKQQVTSEDRGRLLDEFIDTIETPGARPGEEH